MAWTDFDGLIDVTSAFVQNITPPRELLDEIHQRGWDASVKIKDNQYTAIGKNPYGETIEKTGPDPSTALSNLLIGIMRQETIRFQSRVSAWDHTWEQELPEIAKAYAEAPIYDPKAAGAWKELGEDSQRRAEAIANQLHVEFTDDPHPYEDVNDMVGDIQGKRRISIPTANLDHPVWSPEQVLAHRLVLDVLGHAAVGGDWGWHGVNGAVSNIMPLLTPPAQKAMFTENIGQTAHNHFYRTPGLQKIAFLDKYLEDPQSENPGGGSHPSQVIIPSEIPSIEDKTSSNDELEPWSWGNWGKGFINGHNGELMTWNTTNPYEEQTRPNRSTPTRGTPHHEEVSEWISQKMEEEGVPYREWGESDYHSPITISPNGQYTNARTLNHGGLPDGEEHRFQEEFKPLRYIPDVEQWKQQNSGGNQMGHGTHISSETNFDPNDGWSSGVLPLPDNAYLWQKENGKDPLDYQGLRDMSHKMDPEWFSLEHPDGQTDFDSQRQAVVNALRATLLQDGQLPQWAATHYQHLQGVPATVHDPTRLADALEAQRDAHNRSRGIVGAQSAYGPQVDLLKQWIKAQNPTMDDAKINSFAQRELFHMIAEEEGRVISESKGQLSPSEITQAVSKALKKRLTVATKPRIDQKVDFGNDRLFHEGAIDPGAYGDFLYSKLKPLSGVGLHANDIARAAREDVANHGGKGHHFRSQLSDLIPGIGPKEISQAWLHLQPTTSQLAVIDPSVAIALGYNGDISPRDYYSLERQLGTGKDAAGYSHVPIGQFSKGLSDNINFGQGVHRDLSPFRPINPTPYDQVNWSSYPYMPTSQWEDPYWWQSTLPAREQMAKDWDQTVAIKHPSESIPYRTAATIRSIPILTHPETGELIEGSPGMSAMQHAKNTLGLSTEQVWQLDPQIEKHSASLL